MLIQKLFWKKSFKKKKKITNPNQADSEIQLIIPWTGNTE